jgi:hypothetical protein
MERGNGNAIRGSQKLNALTAEQASLLIVALPRSLTVSAVLTCFCDLFVSFDGTKG